MIDDEEISNNMANRIIGYVGDMKNVYDEVRIYAGDNVEIVIIKTGANTYQGALHAMIRAGNKDIGTAVTYGQFNAVIGIHGNGYHVTFDFGNVSIPTDAISSIRYIPIAWDNPDYRGDSE